MQLGLSNLGLVLAEAEYFLGIGTKNTATACIHVALQKNTLTDQLRYKRSVRHCRKQAGWLNR